MKEKKKRIATSSHHPTMITSYGQPKLWRKRRNAELREGNKRRENKYYPRDHILKPFRLFSACQGVEDWGQKWEKVDLIRE